jgi:hypothetical protein
MNTLSVTLSTLVDRALLELEAPTEQGRYVVLGSSALTATSTTTFTLASGFEVNALDLIEFDELILVTEKSDDATPIYTCARSQYYTTASTYAAGVVGRVNPIHPRRRVAEGVRRSFTRMAALGLPLITADTFNRETDLAYVLLPAETQEVYSVRYYSPDTGRVMTLDRWQFIENLDTATFSTGKIIRLPYYVADDDDLIITYRTPYRWSTHPSDPVAASTITVPEGAEDLPALYAAAFVLSGREMSRSQLDRAEEYVNGENARQGYGSTLVRLKWQEFYRALDEARRLHLIPVHRPYVRMPRI